jgi:hypothetical protein
MLQEVKDYFEPRNIRIRISAGTAKSSRSNLLINSSLKDNVLVY